MNQFSLQYKQIHRYLLIVLSYAEVYLTRTTCFVTGNAEMMRTQEEVFNKINVFSSLSRTLRSKKKIWQFLLICFTVKNSMATNKAWGHRRDS